METSPLYRIHDKLKVGDLIVISPGTDQSTVGYLKSPVRNFWLNPGNLGFVLSQTDPYQEGNVRDYLLGIRSKLLGRGVLAQNVSKNLEVQVLQSETERPNKDEQKEFPLTGVNIGDIVLLSAENLRVAGQVHEMGRNQVLLGYRFPEEAPIWMRRYDLSKFRNYENLSAKLR